MEIDPARIASEREATLDRMVRYFLEREGVKALFVSGSVAAGTADPWSDIDFRVVVDPARYDAFLAARTSAPAAWGELLFNQVRPGTQHSVSHFRPFFKVDTFYYRPDQLRPSPWLTLPIRILHDPEGLVRRAIDASQGMEFQPEPEEVEASIRFGLAAAHEVVRRARRGELAYAHKILDELRWAIVDADDYLHGRPSYGFAHFETRPDPELVAVLQGSYGPLEAEALLASLRLLARLYRDQVEALCTRFGLEASAESYGESLDLVVGNERR